MANLLATFGLAFGVVALNTLSVRSERNFGLVGLSFAGSCAFLAALLFWAQLPPSTTIGIGITGLAIGLTAVVIIVIARAIERRSAR